MKRLGNGKGNNLWLGATKVKGAGVNSKHETSFAAATSVYLKDDKKLRDQLAKKKESSKEQQPLSPSHYPLLTFSQVHD